MKKLGAEKLKMTKEEEKATAIQSIKNNNNNKDKFHCQISIGLTLVKKQKSERPKMI